MAQSPMQTLTRWEEHGAHWRVRDERAPDGGVVIELCACTGEPVDQLRSNDPELLRYVSERAGSRPA